MVHQILARRNLELSAHHNHCQRTGSMGIGQTEHHNTLGTAHLEDSHYAPCRNCLRHGCHKQHYSHHEERIGIGKKAHVDNHSNANKEIRNEKRVAHKLKSVHQRRYMRNVSVKDYSGKERAHDALQSGKSRHRTAEEDQREREGKLRNRIAVITEEPSDNLRKHEEYESNVGNTFQREDQPKEPAVHIAVVRS